MQALFRLAHKVIHLLTPSGRPDTPTVLEEGLASYFWPWYVAEVKKVELDPDTWFSDPKYPATYRLIRSLYDTYPDADACIRQLRNATGGSLSVAVRVDLLQRFLPKPPAQDASAFVKRAGI